MKTSIGAPVIALLFGSLSLCQGKMIRNNALMSQMMNHFMQRGIRPAATTEPPSEKPQIHITYYEKNPERILTLMQGVLCKNFPSIPCNVIMRDPKLKKIIAHSIREISSKQKSFSQRGLRSYQYDDNNNDVKKTTQIDVPLVPVTERMYRINSEDLSNFLSVSHTGHFQPKPHYIKEQKTRKQKGPRKNYWSKEKMSMNKKTYPNRSARYRNEVYNVAQGHKRKFYPPVTYRKQNTKIESRLRGSSEEKTQSNSIERSEPMSPPIPFNLDSSEPPVWRLDYMSHAVPTVTKYGYEDERLTGKLTHASNNVLANDNDLAPRKEVLHTDIYIKNNFNRKKSSRSAQGGQFQ